MAELDMWRCLPWYTPSLYAREPSAHHPGEVPERDPMRWSWSAVKACDCEHIRYIELGIASTSCDCRGQEHLPLTLVTVPAFAQ